jgi:hypothetical protein
MAVEYPQAYKIICTIIVWIKLKAIFNVIKVYEENIIYLPAYFYIPYG